MANYLSQSWLIDRRHALRAMGALISLPMLECMLPLRASEKMTATPKRSAAPSQDDDTVLSTQDAANLVGVSRPYIVARIEAGDIPLHQQVGNQRRVLKSAVEAWHRREQTRRRRALGQLGAELDDEIFSR